MAKDMIGNENNARLIQDNNILQEVQMSFLDEIEKCGGSLIAASFALGLTSGDLARRAGALELLSFWQAADYDSMRKSDQNLPSYIALEQVIHAMRQKNGNFGQDANLLALQAGIAKMAREETWTMETLLGYLRAGEDLFAACRDATGTTSVFSSLGLDALDRTAGRILKDNPKLLNELRDPAEDMFGRFFDHLSTEDIERGYFDIISISRGENQSPCWIAGKIIAMGLLPLHHPVLDPILDKQVRRAASIEMDHSALNIAERYHAGLNITLKKSKTLEDPARHNIKLHLAVANSGLRQITEMTASTGKLMIIADHLDRALQEMGQGVEGLHALSLALHMRLHLTMKTEAMLANHDIRGR